jgi:F-type H+-transporting ATPase subunit epsilon
VSVTFRLSVVTPERAFFDDQVEMVVLQALDGEVGVQPGHAPALVALREGITRIQQDGEWRWFAASSGYASILPDGVYAVLQTAEWPDEIDVNRALREKEEAEEILRQKQSMQEYAITRSMLARAMVRLRITRDSSDTK